MNCSPKILCEVNKLNITYLPFQSLMPKYAKKEHAADVVGGVEKQQHTDAKQALRKVILRKVSEIQASRSDKRDDPMVQRLVEKFKSGEKLTQDDMAYLRRNAPGMIDQIERIAREREFVEQSMRVAPSKMDVQNVVLLAIQQTAKHHSYEDRIIRALQIADAQYNYMQTKEYKDKPNSDLDNRKKLASSRRIEKSPMQHTIMAIVAYEQAKLMNSEITAHALKNLNALQSSSRSKKITSVEFDRW